MGYVHLKTREDIRVWLEKWANRLEDDPNMDPVKLIAVSKIAEAVRLNTSTSRVATVVPDDQDDDVV